MTVEHGTGGLSQTLVKSQNNTSPTGESLKSTVIVTMKPEKIIIRKSEGNLDIRIQEPSDEN